MPICQNNKNVCIAVKPIAFCYSSESVNPEKGSSVIDSAFLIDRNFRHSRDERRNVLISVAMDRLIVFLFLRIYAMCLATTARHCGNPLQS
jgi:hypothetical protein